MKCKYILKGKTQNFEFNSEAQLDDFFTKTKMAEKLGLSLDVVYSRSNYQLSTEHKMNEQRAIADRLKATFDEAIRRAKDDEDDIVLNPEPPFIGVTKFLDGRRNAEGNLLTPQFVEDNYWNEKIHAWTDTLRAGESILDKFTEDDLKMLVDGKDSDELSKKFLASRTVNGVYQPLTQEEAENLKKATLQKWAVKNTNGTAIHFVMQQYFSKMADGRYVYELTDTSNPTIKEYIKDKIDTELRAQMGRKFVDLSDSMIDQLIGFAEGFRIHIQDTLRETELDFYPEFRLTADIANTSGKKLMGILDLVVVDKKGVAHIFDYKCSDKSYDKYNSAKKRGFIYQQAIYQRMLRQHGINTFRGEIRIVSIQYKDFKCTNKDEILNTGKATFEFDGIERDPNYSRSIREQIYSINDNNLSPYLDNIDEFLPEQRIMDATTDSAFDFVTRMMHKWFPNYTYAKTYTAEDIRQEVEDAGGLKKGEDGKYHFKWYNKDITADTPETLLDIVAKKHEQAAFRREWMAATVINALEYGQKNNTADIGQIISGIDTKHLTDSNAFQGWFRNYLLQYCNSNWEVVPSEVGRHFGIIMLRNKITNQIDVIKISTAYLKYIKHLNKDTTLLTGAFEPDVREKTNDQSLMLDSANGNIELMETLLFLNTMPAQFGGEYNNACIGNIQVINPGAGTGISASNEQLAYSMNKLKKFEAFEGEDNYSNDIIKFAPEWQLLVNRLKTILYSDYTIANESYYKSALSEMERALSPDTNREMKFQLLVNFINTLEQDYHISQINAQQLNTETRDSEVYRIYFEALAAIADLRGLTYKQQLKESAMWLEKGITNVLTKGASGLMFDNPGNLMSDTLNTITKLLTESYQNTRNEMADPTAKIRTLTEKLKKAKNFGYITSMVKNDIDLYKNMIKRTSDGDLRFTFINDLTGVEQEYLKYVLRVINRNRYNYSEPQLDAMEQDKDNMEYYRVPLCRSNFWSEKGAIINTDAEGNDVTKSMFQALRDEMKKLNPRTALNNLRAKSEGMFKDDDNSYERPQELFKLRTMFDQGEPANGNEQTRLDLIAKHGTAYFEQNLETLFLRHTFAYTSKKNVDKVMPIIKSSIAYLVNLGHTQNYNFSNDVKYLEDYITNKIKNQQIADDPVVGNSESGKKVRAVAGNVRSIASFIALSFSPVQGIYQLMQGLWNDIALIIRKPDGTQAFTFKNFYNAAKIVYKEMFIYSDKPTKCQLINEMYGINDMDMNQYADKLRNDKHGVYNLNEIAYKFTSRPDYYNRMTIIIAQMLEQGTWDALEVKDNKLVYNWKKDQRFSIYANGDTTNPKYNEQRALYETVAQQFIEEQTKNPDGSLFEYGQPLPYVYTNKEAESMKSLCDTVYGYYSHEKKSMVHATFVGALFMQMRTYWSGKKNQYLGSSGVKLQGHWEQLKDDAGNDLFYQTDADGNILRDEPPVAEGQLNSKIKIPYIQWKGMWQEGIILSIANAIRATAQSDEVTWNPLSWREGYMTYLRELTPELREVYRRNLRQLWTDLFAFMILSIILGSMLTDWNKDVAKNAEEDGSFGTAIAACGANVFTRSFINSAQDFNWYSSIFDPMVDTKPYAFAAYGKIFKRVANTFVGDESLYNNAVNTFAATQQFKPFFNYLAPEGGYIFPREEE